MSRRKTTVDERTLFQKTVSNAPPLARVAEAGSPDRSKRKTSLSAGVSGLDGRTDDRLRRGLIEPDARIDLHGFSQRDAHDALLSFLHAARVRRHKLVLVVTGKGARIAPDEPFNLELSYRSRGVLKAAVPRWLREAAFAGLVAGTRLSHKRHGGDGALYVYLRKPD